MNTKSSKESATADIGVARSESSCCGGGARSAPKTVQLQKAAEKPQPDTRPKLVQESAKGKSKGCCCSGG